QALERVLLDCGVSNQANVGDVLGLYVQRRHWPTWVANYLNDPLAGQIVEQLEDGPLSLVELRGRFRGTDPARLRASLEGLVCHLAVFEDTDPETYRLQVGLLPAV